MGLRCLAAGLIWAGLLCIGCELGGGLGGGGGRLAGPPAEGADAGGEDQNAAASRLTQLTLTGQFARAHKLAGEESARAAARDPVLALWWRCQELCVYLREGEPAALAARAELAGLLAADPAARDARFCLSSGWHELFYALVQASRPAQADRLVHDRCRAIGQISPRTVWWHHQMAEVVRLAEMVDDQELARSAAAQVRLPATDPYRSMPAASTQPDRAIQPKALGATGRPR